MPRKRTILDPIKVTMIFHRPDYERMKELHSSTGPQVAIRALVHTYVLKADAKLVAETEELIKEIDIEEVPSV